MSYRDRVKFLSHKGKDILLLDFSDSETDQVLKIIDHARDTIGRQDHGSVLTLTDVTNARFNPEVGEGLKQFALHNRPFVRAGAVVGITGLKRIIFGAVMAFTQRRLEPFDNREQALEWLAGK